MILSTCLNKKLIPENRHFTASGKAVKIVTNYQQKNSMHTIEWPPKYTLQRSPRAKRIIFKIVPGRGLEVVVPKRCALKHVEPCMEQARAWIEKEMAVFYLEQRKRTDMLLPESIHLEAFDEEWLVTYQEAPLKNMKLKAIGNMLLIRGDVQSKEKCYQAISKWAKQYARFRLPPWLRELSEKHQLSLNQISIRDQKGRWGSCSIEKNINLNYKLIFMPKHVAEHILLHELCHTVHLNHSVRFHALLKTVDPDYEVNYRLAKKAQSFVPIWL